MIERYTRPKMGAVWELKNKYDKWLDVEILATEAQAALGNVPEEAVREIKAKASFEAERIQDIESEVHHDVIAFLTNVAEHVGPSARYIHLGLTSSDVVDTGLSLQMREAADLLIEDVTRLSRLLKEKAFAYRDTLMVGRSHGIHAEPMTFGMKFAMWAFEMIRNRERLERAKDAISYGKLSGAVGTYSNVDPEVERYVCERLNLRAASISNQVLQRDRHAEYLTALAICGATLEKIAVELRNLQRTDIFEAEEPFAAGQKGSSAMPHKRNPIIGERVSGLARLLRTNALAGLENVALWHERDISHSSVERVIIPDSAILLDYMLAKMHGVIEGLVVYPENMKRNLATTGGLIFSQKILLALVAKGVSREEAYRLVQRNAMTARQGGGTFQDLIKDDRDIRRHLSAEEVEVCFDTSYYLRHLDTIFNRLEKLDI